MKMTSALRRVAVGAALALGLAPLGALGAGAAESAWPTVNGDPQHSRQGGAVGPTTPSVKWAWKAHPSYDSDGSIGGTATNIPGVLDQSGRLLFKQRNTAFDDVPGPNRYDLLALDPGTGTAETVLSDVQRDHCVPAVAPNGTIWTYQDINQRTEHMSHHDKATSWLVGIDPATNAVVHRYSGEGVHHPNAPAIHNCAGAMQVTSDSAVVVVDGAGFDTWLRVINSNGTSRWERNLEDEHNIMDRAGWHLVARDGTPGQGTVYLGWYAEHPATGNRSVPTISAFDLATGDLRDSITFPGHGFVTNPVLDPEGGLVISTTASRFSGHLQRVVDNGNELSIDWQQAITSDRDRTGALKGVPASLQLAGDRVVGWASDANYLESFAWKTGAFRWSTRADFRQTNQVVVDAAGKSYISRNTSGNEISVFSARGKLVGFLRDDPATTARTVGPLAADGTLYVWGSDIWSALVHDPDGVVPCPAGTSSTVTCQKNQDGGYIMKGTAKDEIFVGSNQTDKMIGRGGDDVMRGRGGSDLLKGGSGNDKLKGNSGRDTLIGGRGNDRLVGGSGNDKLKGNSGRDKLIGGRGNDRLVGGSGNDKLKGNSGRDTLIGGRGNDKLIGGSGRDKFSAGGGSDRINAKGQRKERINCGSGRDKVTHARGDRVKRNCEVVRR